MDWYWGVMDPGQFTRELALLYPVSRTGATLNGPIG
jgi:hypothetical protein